MCATCSDVDLMGVIGLLPSSWEPLNPHGGRDLNSLERHATWVSLTHYISWRCPMQAYCLKCRAHREINEAQEVTLKNGRPATRGKCSVCTATVFRIGKAA